KKKAAALAVCETCCEPLASARFPSPRTRKEPECVEGEVCPRIAVWCSPLPDSDPSSTSSTASRPLPNVRSSTRMASGYTSSALRLQRGACGLGLTFAPSSYGLVTPTWNQQCAT